MLSNPPLPADVATPGTGEFGDHFGSGQPRQLCHQLSRATGHQLEPAGRDVRSGDGPILAGLPHRREPIGGAGFEQSLLGQRAWSYQANDRAIDQRL